MPVFIVPPDIVLAAAVLVTAPLWLPFAWALLSLGFVGWIIWLLFGWWGVAIAAAGTVGFIVYSKVTFRSRLAKLAAPMPRPVRPT